MNLFPTQFWPVAKVDYSESPGESLLCAVASLRGSDHQHPKISGLHNLKVVFFTPLPDLIFRLASREWSALTFCPMVLKLPCSGLVTPFGWIPQSYKAQLLPLPWCFRAPLFFFPPFQTRHHLNNTPEPPISTWFYLLSRRIFTSNILIKPSVNLITTAQRSPK